MELVFEGIVAAGPEALSLDIRSVSAVSFASGDYVVTTNGVNGGVCVMQVQPNGTLVLSDTALYGNLPVDSLLAQPELVTIGGDTYVLVATHGSGDLIGYRLREDGTLGAQDRIDLPGSAITPVCISAVVGASEASHVLVSLDLETGKLTSYVSSGNGYVSGQSKGTDLETRGTIVMESASTPQADFVVVADSGVQGVTTYRIYPDTGQIQQVGRIGQDNGLGVGEPTDLSILHAHGQTWVILTAAQSQSVTVLKMAGNGKLSVADHMTDTLGTRFADAQAVASFEVDGQAFVVVGGTDGGLTLMSMMPDGRLIQRTTLEHALGLGLENITQIEAQVTDDQVNLFISSSLTEGVTQFSLPTDDLGQHLQGAGLVQGTSGNDLLRGTGTGTDRLEGRGGDDVLYASDTDTRLNGGDGADRFVLRPVAATYVIEDFQPGTDVLDLSMFPMLRSPLQLNYSITEDGAVFQHGETVVIVDAVGGGPLAAGDIWDGGFDWADRHVLVDGAEPVPWPEQGPPRANIVLPVDPDRPGGAPALPDVPTVPPLTPTHPGTAGDDKVTGRSNQDDLVLLQGGNDSLWNPGGNNFVDGGAGGDTLSANGGRDTILGGVDNDSIMGLGGHDFLAGQDGRDTVWGGAGDDYVSGGDGVDWVGGAAGDDTVSGGAGDDILYGDGGDDIGLGGDGRDEVWMSLDQDTIYGGNGNDSLGGGDGDDVALGESGDDLIYGGEGHDTLYGGVGRDVIWPGPGDDWVYGDDGNDTVGGGVGQDVVRGGAGNDQVWGGTDDDFLFGDAGNDTLDGEGGSDVFVFAQNHGSDVISRFSLAEDYIYLDQAGLEFSDLTIRYSSQGATVDTTMGDILLTGLSAGDLTEDHFYFA